MKPILFSTPMVQAILAGNKTMTRRYIKHKHPIEEVRPVMRCDQNEKDWGKFILTDENGEDFLIKSPYQPGDVLWVKEQYYAYGKWVKNGLTKTGKQRYRFDTSITGYQYSYPDAPENVLPNSTRETYGWFKRSSLFMPRKAARIFLEVTDVKVERLQDITEEDAMKEGMKLSSYLSLIDRFRILWDSIHSPGAWKRNEWVWCYSFKQIILTK